MSIEADSVAKLFVKTFYETLSHKKDEIVKFYGEDSSFTVTGNSPSVGSSIGNVAIKKKYVNITPSTVIIQSVDAASTVQDAILVIVLGAEEFNDIKTNFSRTFILSRKGDAYYVRTDLVRYLGNEKTPSPSASTATVSRSNNVEKPAARDEAIVKVEKKDISTSPISVEQSAIPVVAVKSQPAKVDEKVDNAKPRKSNGRNNKKDEQTKTTEIKEKLEVAKEKPAPPSVPTTWAARVSGNNNVVAAPVSNEPEKVEKRSNIKRNDSKKSNGVAFKKDNQKTVHVSSLPKDINEKNLRDFFNSFGHVTDVDLISDKGIAYITFATDEAVKAVLKGPVSHKGVTFNVSLKRLTVRSNNNRSNGNKDMKKQQAQAKA